MWRAALLGALALTMGTATACGGDGESDAELVTQIQQSAETRQQEAARQESRIPESPEASDVPDPRPTSGTTATVPAATSSTTALLTGADRASFARLSATLPGAEGVAVSSLGRDRKVHRAGTLRSGVAWSTAKVPVAMAALEAGVGTDRDVTAAITASDNAAAERLWRALGAGEEAAAASDAQLRAAGDTRTTIEPDVLRRGFTAFGQTDWTLGDQTRFVAGMGCTTTGPEVLALMGDVVAAQSWGLGTTGSSARFKGGWGPGIKPGQGGGWLDRQMGVMTVGGRPIAVAIATTAGDHEAGTRSLTAIAQWVTRNVDARAAAKRAVC